MSDWASMNTAPTDGTEVLVWARSHDGDAVPGYYHIARFVQDFGWAVCADEYTVTPTCWMPLPAAPVVLEDASSH